VSESNSIPKKAVQTQNPSQLDSDDHEASSHPETKSELQSVLLSGSCVGVNNYSKPWQRTQ
jgi:hypothetical protein